MNLEGVYDLQAGGGITWVFARRYGENLLGNLGISATGFVNHTWVDMYGYDFEGTDFGGTLQGTYRMTLGRHEDPVLLSWISVLGYSFERGDWWAERMRTDGTCPYPEVPDMLSRNASASGQSIFGGTLAALAIRPEPDTSWELYAGMLATVTDTSNGGYYPESQLVAGLSCTTGRCMVWLDFHMDTGLSVFTGTSQDSMNMGVAFRL